MNTLFAILTNATARGHRNTNESPSDPDRTKPFNSSG